MKVRCAALLLACVTGSVHGVSHVAAAQTVGGFREQTPAERRTPEANVQPQVITGAAPFSGFHFDPPAPPTVDLARQPTLYVVGYAHLDTEWRWAYPQTIREYIANTLHDNFKLFEKYPSYVFNFSGSRRYQMMKEYYPADYEKLKGYIAAGKWFPCGSSVDENDANVPSAESYVRHILYGNRYFRNEFGVASEEYMLPDCFGFPAALPSLLVHCGLKGFSTQKLTWGLAIGQIPFKVGMWEGPDGRALVAALDPGAYVGDVKDNLATNEQWGRRIDNNGSKSGVFVDYHYYGTGDQGGAPKEPSVRMVEESVKTEGHTKVISGPADWMFKAITPEMQQGLPRYKGELELTEHSAGSITSQSFMKRCNRKNELLADAAERAALGAWWLGAASYPGQRIEDAWTLVLGSQMHDILPGTSLPAAYEYAWNDEILAANMFADIAQQSVGAVSSGMDTRATGTAVVVYSPIATAREDIVEFSIPWGPSGKDDSSPVAVGPDGRSMAVQTLSLSNETLRGVFVAKLPACGFAVYDIRRGGVGDAGMIKVDERSLENERYTVKIDDNGDVSSIFDKSQKKEMLTGPARLGLHFEKPSNWPAWNQDWADRQKPAKSFVSGSPKITVVENGPVRGAIRVEREQEGSTFIQEIRLGSGAAGDTVVFHTSVEWNTRERSLRAAFPLAAGNAKATYDIQTGVIERGNGNAKQFENAGHQWVDLTDASGEFGVSLLNDCRYGSDKPDDHTLRQTLLYTPGVRGNYNDQGTQDLGRHELEYAVYSHAKDWKSAGTPWRAARMNQPLRAFIVPKHEGPLGKSVTLLTCDNPNVMVMATKKAEDSDEIVVRLRELTGAPAQGVKVTLAGSVTSAREVDGQEREIGPAKTDGGALVADVHGYGLRAFAVKVAPSKMSVKRSESAPIALKYDVDAVSTNANRPDGGMDPGHAYPAEQLPKQLVVDDVRFDLGPAGDGEKNAVTCSGQEIALPAGIDRVEVLAAATDIPTPATFEAGGMSKTFTIAPWRGFVGQWDNRRWGGNVSETDDSSYKNMIGLDPGYVRPDPVAWFCSHHHTAKQDEHYKYCYLYRYSIDVAGGAKSMRLPNAPGVRVLAMTGVRGTHDRAVAAAPLRDMLADHAQDRQTITASGAPGDSQMVRVEPRLYWRAGSVRYTIDGSNPTISSPVYERPFWLSETATVKAVGFDYSGRPGPISEQKVVVDDHAAPVLKRAATVYQSSSIACEFSEPVDKGTGGSAASYALSASSKIKSVALSEDGRTATLALDQPLGTDKPAMLKIAGIKDRSPAANMIKETSVDLTVHGPVYRLEAADSDHAGARVEGAKNIPTRAAQPWTINMFVKMDKQPTNHTIFAGFGRCAQRAAGTGRYLAKFGDGLHFWSHNNDMQGNTPLELGVWQMITATHDGTMVRLYKNGEKIAEQQMSFADDEPTINIAPEDPWEHKFKFQGDLREFTIWDTCLPEESLKALNGAFKP